jgi:hypothetical protein
MGSMVLSRFERVPRFPRAPLWALLAVLGVCALAGAEGYLSQRWGLPLDTCQFKRFTGIPCPTCGTTRGALALLAGHPLRALGWNPLFFICLGLAAAWFAFRACTGLTPRLETGRYAWIAFLAAVLANWAYLIIRGV